MGAFLKKYSLLIIIAAVVISLDQYTKFLVRSNLGIGEVWSPWDWLTPFARIVYWHNTGAAFGLFQGGGNVFAALAVVIVLVIIYYFPQVPKDEWALRLAMSMQMGGAIGNLIDRIQIGHVVDFISVGSFPVFNIADGSITVGVGILIIGLWLQEKREKTNSNNTGISPVNDPASTNGENSG